MTASNAPMFARAAELSHASDPSTWRFLYCRPCDVSWRGPSGDHCWCCGRSGSYVWEP